ITENTGGGIGNLKEHKVIDNFEYIPDDGVPETLGYGFAASTGDNVNYHEIRNIEILASSAAPPNAVKDFSKSGKKNVPIPFTAADFYVTDVNVSNFTDPNDDALDRIR